MRPQKNSTNQIGKDAADKTKGQNIRWEVLWLWYMALVCSEDNDVVLTSVGDSMYLTAAVYSNTQQGCFIIPFDIFAFQQIRQEREVCHNNAVGLLYIIQLLHTHTEYNQVIITEHWLMYLLLWDVCPHCLYLEGEGNVDSYWSCHGSKAKKCSRVTVKDKILDFGLTSTEEKFKWPWSSLNHNSCSRERDLVETHRQIRSYCPIVSQW